MKMEDLYPRVCVIALSTIAMCGCALFESSPVRYYTLSSVADPIAAASTPAAGPIFAVAPVRIPQYLSQRWIVTKMGETEINLAENDQWGSPLADDIAMVLSENLTTMIPSERVVQLPVSASVPIDYEIRVEIVSFEHQPNDSVDLVARWTVFGEGGRHMVTMNRSAFSIADVSYDYPSITRAMSALLADLSREIAAVVRRLPATAATS